MSKLFALLLLTVAISFVSAFLPHGAMRRQTRLNTFYDRQSGANNNKPDSSKPDPNKKKDLGNKWNTQMKSAFTPSSQRTCEDEIKELSINTEGKDFGAQTALGSRLSQKLRAQALLMQSESGEMEAESVKNESKDLFAI